MPFMGYPISRTCLLVTQVLQAIVSIVALCLKSTSYHFISTHHGEKIQFSTTENHQSTIISRALASATAGNSTHEPNSILIDALPPHLNNTTTHLVIASSVISLMTLLILAGFTAWANSWKTRRSCTITTETAFLFILLNGLLYLSTFAYSTYVHLHSAHLDFSPSSSGVSTIPTSPALLNGTFDLETWVCDLTNAHHLRSLFAHQCSIEHGARGNCATAFVLAMAAVGMGVWVLRRESRVWRDMMEKSAEGRVVELRKAQTDGHLEGPEGGEGREDPYKGSKGRGWERLSDA